MLVAANLTKAGKTAFLDCNFDRAQVAPNSPPKLKKAAKKINKHSERAAAFIDASQEARRLMPAGTLVKVTHKGPSFGTLARVVGPCDGGKYEIKFEDPKLKNKKYVRSNFQRVEEEGEEIDA